MASPDGVLVHRGQLVEIPNGPQVDIEPHELTVIAIPDIGTNSATMWSNGERCWLTSLFPRVRSQSRILGYSYTVDSTTGFAWRALLEKGEDLLECLLERDDLLQVLHLKENVGVNPS